LPGRALWERVPGQMDQTDRYPGQQGLVWELELSERGPAHLAWALGPEVVPHPVAQTDRFRR
jgi:hypothetical protein